MGLVEWTVAGALVESAEGLLLVRNERHGGRTDWSTPGGVIDATDESLRHGLTREVEEETGLRVMAWEGPLYTVVANAPDLGWVMTCEVHRAIAYEGVLHVDDPDGIVVEAAFTASEACVDLLALCAPWVREPLVDWLVDRWGPGDARAYTYDVFGSERDSLRVVRT